MKRYNPRKCGICHRLNGRHRASCAYLNNPSAPRHGHTKDDIRRFEDEYNRQEDRLQELLYGPPFHIIGLHP